MQRLKDVPNNKIRELITHIFKVEPLRITRFAGSDLVEVEIEKEWETGELGKTRKIRDIIYLTKRGISSNTIPLDMLDGHLYQQWLIAVHRHYLQEGNPFLADAQD